MTIICAEPHVIAPKLGTTVFAELTLSKCGQLDILKMWLYSS